MAKRKDKQVPTVEAEPVRARDIGLVKLLNAEIETALSDALDACVARTRHKKRVVVAMALEEYLTKQGFWPPQASEPVPDLQPTPRQKKRNGEN